MQCRPSDGFGTDGPVPGNGSLGDADVDGGVGEAGAAWQVDGLPPGMQAPRPVVAGLECEAQQLAVDTIGRAVEERAAVKPVRVDR